MAKQPAALTPERVEKDLPKDTVTVAFKVESVARLTGAIPAGDPPHMPIALTTTAGLKDKRSQFGVVIVGKALEAVHHLGIDDAAAHFRGKTVRATGKVDIERFPRVSGPGGANVLQPDNYPHYEIVIDDLNYLRIVR